MYAAYLFILLLTAPILTMANTPVIIKQLILDRHYVVASAEPSIIYKIGDILLASFTDGSQCSLKISSKKDDFLILDSKSCSRSSELRVNQSLELALIQDTNENSEPLLPQKNNADHLTAPSSHGEVHSINSVTRFTPHKKTDLTFEYTYSKIDITRRAKSVTASLTDKTTTSSSRAKASYGLTSNISIGMTASYQISQNLESRTSGALGTNNNSSTSSGLEDPSLTISYLAHAQNENRPFNLKLDITYTPTMISATTANAASGGDILITELALSHFLGKTELGLIFNYTNFGVAKFENEDSGHTTRVSTRDSAGIGVYGQTSLNKYTYVSIGLGWIAYSDAQSKNTDTGVTFYRAKSHQSSLINLGTKFILEENTSAISFNFTFQKVSDLQGDITISGQNEEWVADDVSLNTALLSYIYRFN